MSMSLFGVKKSSKFYHKTYKKKLGVNIISSTFCRIDISESMSNANVDLVRHYGDRE